MRRLLALSIVILAGSSAAALAAADPAALRAEAGRLAAELARVRQVDLAQAQTTAPDSNLRAAALEVRLARLEEELRRLTGRIEEIEHGQSDLRDRMDGLVREVDNRLQALESGQAAAPPATPGPAAAAPEAAPPAIGQMATDQMPQTLSSEAQPRTITPTARPTIQPDAAARQGYVLGTLPEETLRSGRTPALPAPGEPPTATQEARLTPQGADADYRRGIDLLQSGKWGDAEQAFTGFVQAYPDDRRAAAASYWLAETYFVRKDYPTAAAVFARNYRTYGEAAPRAPENLLKLGMSLAAMGDKDRACQSFAELAKRHPDAPAPVRQQLSRERAAAGCPA